MHKCRTCGRIDLDEHRPICPIHGHDTMKRIIQSGPLHPLKPDDPAAWMLTNGHTTTPVVYDERCYICNDPEFAQMGMSLCMVCSQCKLRDGTLGHVPADDEVCTVCGGNEREYQARQNAGA